MYTQMFITSVVVQLLPQQLEISHLMLLHVIMCHSTATAMPLKCPSNVTPIGREMVFRKSEPILK